jgi:CheY-like chemotaxis protein
MARNRVLIIDDNAAVRETFRRLLVAEGFDVVVATGGAEGLAVLRTDPTIGLVLLDFDMPRVNGSDVRRAQLADPELAAIPTVVVSGSRHFDPAHLPGVSYLEKPVSRQQLVEVVSQYCSTQG